MLIWCICMLFTKSMISVWIISTTIMWLMVITVGVAITKHWRLHVRRRWQRLAVVRVRIGTELMMTVVGWCAWSVAHALVMIMLMGLRLLIWWVVKAVWWAWRNGLLASIKITFIHEATWLCAHKTYPIFPLASVCALHGWTIVLGFGRWDGLESAWRRRLSGRWTDLCKFRWLNVIGLCSWIVSTNWFQNELRKQTKRDGQRKRVWICAIES